MIQKPVASSVRKRANLMRATDQRTTSGPADPILRAKGRRHDRTQDPRRRPDMTMPNLGISGFCQCLRHFVAVIAQVWVIAA